ncbi:hypothetical protein RCJ22_16090 [Vibrio sp. FNV 38]|nr:hypothetical protein [Vibrio sp. FNV 38]
MFRALASLFFFPTLCFASGWQYISVTDPMTDEVYAAAVHDDEHGTNAAIECSAEANKLYLNVQFKIDAAPLIGMTKHEVLFRVDKNDLKKHSTLNWRWFSSFPVESILELHEQMMAGKMLNIRTTVSNEVYNKELSLKGYTKAYNAIKSYCNGSPVDHPMLSTVANQHYKPSF